MAKLIFKAPYYKAFSRTPTGSSRGGYARYIATREGVEILPRSGMADYIGERKGSNGLFSDAGKPIVLSLIEEELDNHRGNVWGMIFSLKREDAERLGYNSADQWMNLLRSRRNDIAKEMHIAPSNFRWYAAYHNDEKHPHVHMLAWSSNPHEPYLSKLGIAHIKQAITNDVFRDEKYHIYKKQTEARDSLKEEFRRRIVAITNNLLNDPVKISPELIVMFENLSQSLAKHKGKKVYGYLSKKDKDIVDNIVKTIAEDEKIAELYELWYRLQCETFRTYTDQMPPKVPIEENKEFKPLRNFVVKSTADMLPDMPVGRSFDVDYKTPTESEDSMIRLRFKAEDGNVHAMYRLARRYLTEENNAGEAEYWLKKAADKGNVYAIYFLYQCYRDGRIKDTNNAKMKYLLMAVDKKFAYAEYDYGKHLDAKEDPMGLEYLRQAAKHGCVQAEYAIGKRMLKNGQTEEGLKYLESAAEKDNWSRFYLGLMYCYRLNDWDKGMEYLRSASEQGFEPAQNAINNIQKGLNAQIVTGICNLFYYASRIIDDRAESEYPHPAFDAVESRAKKEDRAKRMGIAYTGM